MPEQFDAAPVSPAPAGGVEPVTAPPFAGGGQAYPYPAEPGIEPVTAPPADSGASWADAVWERSAAPEVVVEAEPAVPETAVPEQEPAAEDEHGLGWLLSQSGLGQVSSAPEAGAEPESELTATEDPRPVSARPVSVAPISSDPVSSAPTSGVPISPTAADDARDGATPVDDAPASAAPPGYFPGGSTSADDIPASPTPPNYGPGYPASTNDTPVSATPASGRPAGEAPAAEDWFAPSGALPIIVPRDERIGDDDPVEPVRVDPEIVAEPIEDFGYDSVDVISAAETPAETPVAEPIGAEIEAIVVDAELIEPISADPISVAPRSADPVSAEPIDALVIEPFALDPAPAETRTPEPETVEPQPTEPQPAEPQAAEPETAEPETAEPETAEPETAEPEPGPTGPETAGLEATGHENSEALDSPEDTAAEPASATEAVPEAVETLPAADEDAAHDQEPEPPPETATAEEPEPAAETRPPVHAPIRQRRTPIAEKDRRRQDPEQVLAAYPLVFDPETQRERIEETDPMWVVVDRLTDKLEYAERDAVRARLLSLRAVAGRLLDDLDAAEADGRRALQHAEPTGDLRLIATTKARLAGVLQWKGEFGEADRLYAEAASPELPPRLGAEVHELAGRSAFEQGRYLEAMNHFETALDLRKGADPEMVERIELALDVITRHTREGWGPYPRTREEILGEPAPPQPLRDERSGLWGYVGAAPPRFAQAQPFADGVAWVRRPEAPAWELIDASGRLLIDASAGYLAAGRFAEGMAWVSRDQQGGWFAIDQQNRVIVPGGFDDAKPFHRGLALIRRGGWGAIDRHGRVVVQPRYRGFATALSGGQPIDGFTDEGLAVIDAGDRYGVVDRSGQLIVAPVHAAVRIHPTAFLIADKYGLWGALDRDGDPMVELKYAKLADVLDEVDRRTPAERPVL